ncbi:MAG TPA: peptide deformylase [Candidatus Gallacutalibacter stercoravium]|nr:peptide deformylase [Candidatus Gallacutalibacter stercoravium]
MAVRRIRKYPDEALRSICQPVKRVNGRVRALLRDMADTMYHASNGCGLAACQIGVPLRLVVIDVDDELIKLVNPQIVESSGEQIAIEGCLSFPDLWGKVRRPAWVKVRALNGWGRPIEIEGEDLMAVCLCHEIDHLDGVVFTDKVLEYVED